MTLIYASKKKKSIKTTFQFMETEQTSSLWKMDQDRNKGIKDLLEFSENKYAAYPNLGTQRRWCREEGW